LTARILIIAGSDSGGGAGIQADIKTVTMLGGHAMTAVTAITAQNTLGVQAVHAVPADMVVAQIESVVSDLGVDAIKIGMIGSAETAHAVAERLETLSVPIVFDPVMVATSGSVLADVETIAAFERLMRIATVTTPNLPELEALGGEAAMKGMTLIKGGHREGDVIVDRLIGPIGEVARWEDARIESTNTHGTGCTLASGIATGLGHGLSLADAIGWARLFVRLAMQGAPGLGGGHGPMGHQSVRNDATLSGPILNQVTLAADDYAASVAFYKALGLTQIVDSPSNGYARFEAGNGGTLSLHYDHTFKPSSGTVVYLESANLDIWVNQLKQAGLQFSSNPQDRDWLWRDAYLNDPFGNLICLYQAGENRRFPPWRI
jgi:hydroxymethylpyrimidine/phosphomethylpyrimidine kinase